MTDPKLLVFLGAFTALGLNGCKKEQPRQQAVSDTPTPTTVSSAPAPAITVPQPTGTSARQAPEPLTVGITWDDPSGWKRSPRKSPMRAATYTFPLAEGDDGAAEVAVFYFGPGQGGDIDGNVTRWAGQFGKELSDVKRTNREVHGLKQHVVEIEKGDFKNDMMGKAGSTMKDWSMLAAIVEAPSGSYFFKMTGPMKSVQAQKDSFFGLLDSIETRQ